MKAFKTKVKLKELKTIINIPDDISSPEVEIIILSDSHNRKTMPLKRKRKELGGVLNKYANANLIDSEKDIAWTKIIEEKHGIL